MNRIEWLTEVKLLASIWPNQPLPAETIEEWEKLLSIFAAETITEATRKLAKTEAMRPGVAELIKASRSVMAERRMQAVATPTRNLEAAMARDPRPFVKLLNWAVELWRAGTIPTADYLSLTDWRKPGRMHDGQPTDHWKQELARDLATIESAAKPEVVSA